jgi:protein-tyrosine phosphatase
MIDIHVHILPGIDDGPATMEESLEMARIAVEDGIHTIIATPHSLDGVHFNRRSDILSACAELNAALGKHHIPLTLLPGSEARLSIEITDELEKGRLMTLNDTGRYISLELPDQFISQATTIFIERLKDGNLTPIISHPERNPAIQQNVVLLSDLISAGALCQITADSLLGAFGPHALQCCEKLIELNMVHFMASDAHSPRARPPNLSKGYEKLTALAGTIHATRIMSKFPQNVVDGR